MCSDGYTHALGPSCNKCSDATGLGIALVVVLGVAILAGFVGFLTYMLSGQEQDTDQGIVARLARYIPLHSLKIVIVVWQILTQVRLHRPVIIIDGGSLTQVLVADAFDPTVVHFCCLHRVARYIFNIKYILYKILVKIV